MKTKIIKDFVHGYITIPLSYITNFIDTPHFQRLRRIEQTSMRALYPSSRHDRFIHSLGTFHLGCMAIDWLEKNSRDVISMTSEDVNSFKIACLLHDCGHAPFSHTFEDYFKKESLKQTFLKLARKDEALKDDMEEVPDSASHEYLSAILALSVYREAIEKENANPELVARMITGIGYCDNNYKNALIQLLNGRAIDVDKLDYVVRDISVSGIKTVQVDLERIIRALQIDTTDGGRYRLCFHKNALSAINNVFEVKNFLAQWVFSHHTVQYDQFLLKKSVDGVIKSLNPKMDFDCAVSKLFDPNTYIKPSDVPVKMLCDDDLVALMKTYPVKPYTDEWLYRQYTMKPIWKSYFEFCHIFDKPSIKTSEKTIRRALTSVFKDESNFIILMQEEKNAVIEHDELFVKMSEDNVVPYGDINFHLSKSWADRFFYVFVKSECLKDRESAIAALKAKL